MTRVIYTLTTEGVKLITNMNHPNEQIAVTRAWPPPISKPKDSVRTTRTKARLAVAEYAQAEAAQLDIDIALFVMGHKLDVFRTHVVEYTGDVGSCSVSYWTYSKDVPWAKAWPEGWRWVTPYSSCPEHAVKVEKRIRELGLAEAYVAALTKSAPDAFSMVTATPRQRCLAALAAIDSTQEGMGER